MILRDRGVPAPLKKTEGPTTPRAFRLSYRRRPAASFLLPSLPLEPVILSGALRALVSRPALAGRARGAVEGSLFAFVRFAFAYVAAAFKPARGFLRARLFTLRHEG